MENGPGSRPVTSSSISTWLAVVGARHAAHRLGQHDRVLQVSTRGFSTRGAAFLAWAGASVTSGRGSGGAAAGHCTAA